MYCNRIYCDRLFEAEKECDNQNTHKTNANMPHVFPRFKAS